MITIYLCFSFSCLWQACYKTLIFHVSCDMSNLMFNMMHLSTLISSNFGHSPSWIYNSIHLIFFIGNRFLLFHFDSFFHLEIRMKCHTVLFFFFVENIKNKNNNKFYCHQQNFYVHHAGDGLTAVDTLSCQLLSIAHSSWNTFMNVFCQIFIFLKGDCLIEPELQYQC